MSKLSPNYSFEKLVTQAVLLTNEHVLNKTQTVTRPGSLTFWLRGPQASDQSIAIKFGKVGEHIAKWMIANSPRNLELLDCGVLLTSTGKKRDFDLLWRDPETNTIFLREMKGNIELDSEKLPATFEKMRSELQPELEKMYPGATIDVGILNWSIYRRQQLTKGLSQIRKCESKGVPVDHMQEFAQRLDLPLTQGEWNAIGQHLGNQVWS